MATRAAYQFIYSNVNDNRKAGAVFYIHHDGYTAGAAHYFLAMLDRTGHADANAFFRANGGAELTASVEYHSDIDYKYTVYQADDTIRVEKRNYDSPTNQWRTIFSGSLASFLTRASGAIVCSVKYSEWMNSTLLMSAEIASKRIAEAEEKLAGYRKAFPKMAGNISSLESEVLRAKGWLAYIEVQPFTASLIE
jgi:hypothetical protein